MNFGVPNQRRKREEKYPDTPVITIDIDGGKGSTRKMYLNDKAIELLGLPENNAMVAFHFPMDNPKNIAIYNGDQAGIPKDICLRVTKTHPRGIGDKKTYQYISKVLELDTSVENEFRINTTPWVAEDGAPRGFHIEPIVQDEDPVNSPSQDLSSFGGADANSANEPESADVSQTLT